MLVAIFSVSIFDRLTEFINFETIAEIDQTETFLFWCLCFVLFTE